MTNKVIPKTKKGARFFETQCRTLQAKVADEKQQ